VGNGVSPLLLGENTMTTNNIPNISALNIVSTGIVSSAELIEAMVLVNVEISIWSAKKKMAPEDFGGVNLPPDQLASLGSKNVFDPKRIDEFCRIRSEAHSFMRRIGVRFGSGYVISQAILPDVSNKMAELKAEFTTKRDEFMSSYDEELDLWLNDPENRGWSHIISGSIVDRDHVASRMKFRWHALKLLPAGSASDFMEDVESLPTLLFEEIADEAKKLLATTVSAQRGEATQKALRPFRTLSDKLQGLSFIDPKAAALKKGIDSVLDVMPSKGKLADCDLSRLRGLATILSSPNSAMEFAEKMKGSATAHQLTIPIPALAADTEEDAQTSEEMGIIPVPEFERSPAVENAKPCAVAPEPDPVENEERSEELADCIPQLFADNDLLAALGF
jgi:hypothetical protein